MDALFATPQGKKTWIVRIPRESRYRAAVHHLLRPLGFSAAGDSTHLRWFVREEAPAALKSKVRGIVGANAVVN
jgi:hypothetical protein